MSGLACLGGFENVRREYEWGGHLLELDETKYEWGTLYELECETVGGSLLCFWVALCARYGICVAVHQGLCEGSMQF